jgi:hypothetical protein
MTKMGYEPNVNNIAYTLNILYAMQGLVDTIPKGGEKLVTIHKHAHRLKRGEWLLHLSGL